MKGFKLLITFFNKNEKILLFIKIIAPSLYGFKQSIYSPIIFKVT